MSKGYIKKERLRLLNTKVFFKHSEGNHSYSTYSLSQRGYDQSEVLVNEQLIDCKEMTHFQNNRLCMLIDLVDNVIRYSTPLTQ